MMAQMQEDAMQTAAQVAIQEQEMQFHHDVKEDEEGKGPKGHTLMDQAASYVARISVFAKSLGINLSMHNVKKALQHVDVKKLLSCVMSQMLPGNGMNLMKCGMQFAATGMEVLESLRHSTVEEKKE